MKCDICHLDGGSKLRFGDKERDSCVECHGWYDVMEKKTAPPSKEQMNPHSQHDGELPCTECHKGHQPGVNYCGQCHSFEFKVP